MSVLDNLENEYTHLLIELKCKRLPDVVLVRNKHKVERRYVQERTAKKLAVRVDDSIGRYECSECRSTVLGRDVFCWYCGARFEEDE